MTVMGPAGVHVPRPRSAVAALASTALLSSFLQTIMTPVVPELPERMGVSGAGAAWVFTAALLAACATAPVSGRLGDMYGRKRMMLVLLGVIVIGSVIGATATTLPGLIVARSCQGIGLGLMALNLSVLRDVVPENTLPRAIATVAACNGIGGGLGLPLSAAVAQFLDYHWLFVLSGALATIIAVAIVVLVPATSATGKGRFDALGACGVAIGLTAIMLAISQGSQWGWLSPATLACSLGGFGVLALWVAHELRVDAPLIDLRTVTRRAVLVVNFLSLAAGFCWFAVPGVLARYAQSRSPDGAGLGLEMLPASLLLVPTGIVMLLNSRRAARVVRRAGPRRAFIIGSAILSCTFAFAVAVPGSALSVVITAGLVGLGSGYVFAAAPVAIARAVPVRISAAANATNAVTRWLGTTLSSAIVGAILAGWTIAHAGIAGPAAAAYSVCFAVSAAVSVAALLLCFALPKDGSTRA